MEMDEGIETTSEVCSEECRMCEYARKVLSECFYLSYNENNQWYIMNVLKLAKFLLSSENFYHLESRLKAFRTTKRKRNPQKEGEIVEPFWNALFKFMMKEEIEFVKSTCPVDDCYFDSEFQNGIPLTDKFPLIDGEILVKCSIESNEADKLLIFARNLLNSKSFAYGQKGLEQLTLAEKTTYQEAPKMSFYQVKTTFKEMVEKTVTSTTFKTLDVFIDGTAQRMRIGIMDLPKYPLIREKIQFLTLMSNNKIQLRASLYNESFPYLLMLDGPAWKRYFLEHCFEKESPCKSLETMKDVIDSIYTKNTTPKKLRPSKPPQDVHTNSIMPSPAHQVAASKFTPRNKANIKKKTEDLIEAVERMELHNFSDDDVSRTLFH